MNNRGGRGNNIPYDFEVEHSNRFNKEGVKNAGPNLSERAVQRISNSESGTRSMLDGVDGSISQLRGSRQHTSSSTGKNLHELIKRAVQTEVFTRKSFNSMIISKTLKETLPRTLTCLRCTPGLTSIKETFAVVTRRGDYLVSIFHLGSVNGNINRKLGYKLL